MSKVNIKAFSPNLELKYIDTIKELSAKTYSYQHLNSEHGKSTAVVQCGFCHNANTVYVWSFNGSGKRCHSCGAQMGIWRTYLSIEMLTKAQMFDLIEYCARDKLSYHKACNHSKTELCAQLHEILKKKY